MRYLLVMIMSLMLAAPAFAANTTDAPAAPHAARKANGPAVEQQFFRQGGFAGVGVADDGKGAPALDFFCCCHKTLYLSIFCSWLSWEAHFL